MEENDFVKFGDFLKKARVEKGLTLEVISDDIKISVKYLKALEDSNIELFPNEVLAVGFLRTYSEYLDVDVWYISSLFKEYKRRLNDSYIGIKPENKNVGSNFASEGKLANKSIDVSKINSARMIKILVVLVSLVVLIFFIFNFNEINTYLKKIFKSNHVARKSPEVHEIPFDKESFWNASLADGDFLSLIYGDTILKYRVSFKNDDLVITDELSNSRDVFKLGKAREIDFNDNIRVKMIYENYSRDRLKKAHVSLESFILNVEYVSETSLSNRFEILDWGFAVNGPKSRMVSEYPTLYSSQNIVNIDLMIRFLNDTFLRYADENNLSGKSLLVSKNNSLNLSFRKSLILFLSRLSDVNIALQGKDITSILKGYEKELMAVQFFWLKTPVGFDLKVSEVY
ncbi:helix-turn-helix domain-containing protein [Borrelia turcica IST7]|uniref:Helix-turn-helix domain-containing protein n=1 Tax=Borrelia turcica IST7 TaxID=1104446 RepID=A0A386PMP5_9SPIR|nr:helix-turn-helix domain-containing protein [Borrelia turcica]AYE36223.1 helix-turn-helix domain-containing protein [Borrelia turcica IST7]